MYDLRRWPRIYEPADFRAYLPDFALTEASLVYTESKPIVDLPNNLTRKIALSGCGVEDVMVVGLNVRPSKDWLGFLSMGLFRNSNLADDYPGPALGRRLGHRARHARSVTTRVPAPHPCHRGPWR